MVVAAVVVAAVVALAAVAVAAVAVVAVAHAHDHLDRLDRPCSLQELAKHPFGPQPASALCTHTQRASLPHPQGPLLLPAAALPSAWQPVQQLPISLPPPVLPGHGLSGPLQPGEEISRAPHNLAMNEHAPQRAAHARLPRQPCAVPRRS